MTPERLQTLIAGDEDGGKVSGVRLRHGKHADPARLAALVAAASLVKKPEAKTRPSLHQLVEAGHEMNAGNTRLSAGVARVRSLALGSYLRPLVACPEGPRGFGRVLTPGRYVNAEMGKDDAAVRHAGGAPFEGTVKRFTGSPRKQQAEVAKFDAVIAANLKEPVYGD